MKQAAIYLSLLLAVTLSTATTPTSSSTTAAATPTTTTPTLHINSNGHHNNNSTTFRCPGNCECTSVQRGQYLHNHARCPNVEDVRTLGKRADIHSLDLSDLDLTKITNQLDKLSNLMKLDLSGNQLVEVNSLTNKHIRTLNLARNRMTSSKLLTIPVHVKHLDLSANNITELPLDFKRLTNLKSLELHGNPLDCSCDTLEVRNWLQEKLIWTDKPIVCTTPEKYAGKPWLQIRQSDVCEATSSDEPRILPYGGHDDDENDLMLGDDPGVDVDANGETTTEDAKTEDDATAGDDEELDKEFLPVTPDPRKSTVADVDLPDETVYDDTLSNEGSGDEEESDVSKPLDEHEHEDLYEGSGDEVTEVPIIARKFNANVEGGVETTSTTEAPTTVPIATDDDNHGVELFNALPKAHDDQKPLQEDEKLENTTVVDVVPVVHKLDDGEKKAAAGTDPQQSDKIQLDGQSNGRSDSAATETKESKSTYILLAVLSVLLVVLILFVACKRKRRPTKIPVDDARSGARELLPVQKKPQVIAGQNGSPPEIVPLIAQNGKANNCDTAAKDLEGPLLQKLNEPEDTNGDLAKPSTVTPIAEVSYENELAETVPTPSTAPASPNKDYQPVSPNPSRYSPVSACTHYFVLFDL